MDSIIRYQLQRTCLEIHKRTKIFTYFYLHDSTVTFYNSYAAITVPLDDIDIDKIVEVLGNDK